MPPATTSGQAMTNLQNFTNGMQSPQQFMTSANNQFGIPGQQQQVQGLRQSLQNTSSLLNQVAPSVMGRTANSLVTSAQANRMIQNEQAPLNTQFNKEQTDYSNANSDYMNSLQQAEQLANANLGAQTQQQSYLQGIYNDLYTQEQNAAQLAMQKYQADAAVRAAGAANPSLGGGYGGGAGGNGGGGAGGGGNVPSFASMIQQLLPKDYASYYNSGYTERTVLPKLAQLYPELSVGGAGKQLLPQYQSQVYNYRNTLDKANQPAVKGMSLGFGPFSTGLIKF